MKYLNNFVSGLAKIDKNAAQKIFTPKWLTVH